MKRFQTLESLISDSNSFVIGHNQCCFNNTTTMAIFKANQKNDIEFALSSLGFTGDHDLWSHKSGDKVILTGNTWGYRTSQGFVRVETSQNVSIWADN